MMETFSAPNKKRGGGGGCKKFFWSLLGVDHNPHLIHGFELLYTCLNGLEIIFPHPQFLSFAVSHRKRLFPFYSLTLIIINLYVFYLVWSFLGLSAPGRFNQKSQSFTCILNFLLKPLISKKLSTIAQKVGPIFSSGSYISQLHFPSTLLHNTNLLNMYPASSPKTTQPHQKAPITVNLTTTAHPNPPDASKPFSNVQKTLTNPNSTSLKTPRCHTNETKNTPKAKNSDKKKTENQTNQVWTMKKKKSIHISDSNQPNGFLKEHSFLCIDLSEESIFHACWEGMNGMIEICGTCFINIWPCRIWKNYLIPKKSLNDSMLHSKHSNGVHSKQVHRIYCTLDLSQLIISLLKHPWLHIFPKYIIHDHPHLRCLVLCYHFQRVLSASLYCYYFVSRRPTFPDQFSMQVISLLQPPNYSLNFSAVNNPKPTLEFPSLTYQVEKSFYKSRLRWVSFYNHFLQKIHPLESSQIAPLSSTQIEQQQCLRFEFFVSLVSFLFFFLFSFLVYLI
ncbi:hypothetical protein VP01_3902g1 [Puccinia sorghi]|uniref:Uncharacterized protein n=1 Tax=Puccinia sorghi TaxID=27349 RepID=A0A0L6USP2_9BASI|nr:hypothetical protein VP01_3902g1 [Puccinia sorghi]